MKRRDAAFPGCEVNLEKASHVPVFNKDLIHVAFDMHGCPNACSHCWLGNNRTQTMTEVTCP